ncbi:MAG TPA: glycosyltransferase family 8 protein [Candidatus Lachnoclostridium stercorigallinarum]|uniref:Glycosyltransferase family 8 protein n=1 Tax=Candidatus Lachnoclostridium stercorigallinarum TaxID=2838634 RepID=A0A9D2K5Y9_9FIRM|nr:glycosyltransferase family 8 protein [Candidatus Lachnoclostridium stercorigallinarum]
METISILAALDENYLPQLQVMLTSMYLNNPGERADIYLLYSSIPEYKLAAVKKQLDFMGYGFYPVPVDRTLFDGAPVTKQYPREMYYRLLASRFLPEKLDRVLYLDPDILIINPLRPLWELDLKGNLFGAAAHTGITELANRVNRVRLDSGSDYYNSGVLLMDLSAGRREIRPEEIFRFVEEHGKELLLPDQDLLNAMYGRKILPLDDAMWNYDARNYNNYLLRSGGVCDLDWVMEHTAVLHFCGKAKPWKPGYVYRFGVLYKHYARVASRLFLKEEGERHED